MFGSMLRRHSYDIVVIDEGDRALRRKNKQLLEGMTYRFYGPRERKAYFSKTFGRIGLKASHVIPVRCHAETSFGFLLAYEEQPHLVLELDDDTFPVAGSPIIDGHFANLQSHDGLVVSSPNAWYNSVENLQLNVRDQIFPRGHPYDPSVRSTELSWSNASSRIVLNMGLWLGDPDLDALTILSRGGMHGKCDVKSTKIRRNRVVVREGTYFALCSMNTAFKPEIIPAFYQLYMNYMGIDRFDDIWSGIFLKKVADHLGIGLSLGGPVVRHEKRPRDVFRDLRAENEGMAINEILWRIINGLDLEGKDYWTAYRSLSEGLELALRKLGRPFWRKLIRVQTRKMQAWLRLIDKL
jgi:hypothetical protein